MEIHFHDYVITFSCSNLCMVEKLLEYRVQSALYLPVEVLLGRQVHKLWLGCRLQGFLDENVHRNMRLNTTGRRAAKGEARGEVQIRGTKYHFPIRTRRNVGPQDER